MSAVPANLSSPPHPDRAPVDDLAQPFRLESMGVRGRLVRLGPALDRILGPHRYPPAVAEILAEGVTMASVLATGLKYDGIFTLQTRGDGPVGTLVADVTSDGALRGYARFDAHRLDDAAEGAGGPVPRLLGAGHMAFTVDQGPDTERYQGITELAGATLADCAHTYFRSSEQLATAMALRARTREGEAGVAAGARACALVLQHLPTETPVRLGGGAGARRGGGRGLAPGRDPHGRPDHGGDAGPGPGARGPALPSVPPGGHPGLSAKAPGPGLPLLPAAGGGDPPHAAAPRGGGDVGRRCGHRHLRVLQVRLRLRASGPGRGLRALMAARPPWNDGAMASFRLLLGAAGAFLLPGLLAGLLAGCESSVLPGGFSEITFEHRPKLTLDVAAVQVDTRFRASLAAPNVEHLVPAPPDRALQRWARDRLRAAGRGGSARFEILDAAVVEERLPVTRGLRGAFVSEQSERYTARAEARLTVFDDRGNLLASATANATRATTVAEDATLSEREKAWFELTEALMGIFDAEMERVTRRFLGGFLL